MTQYAIPSFYGYDFVIVFERGSLSYLIEQLANVTNIPNLFLNA